MLFDLTTPEGRAAALANEQEVERLRRSARRTVDAEDRASKMRRPALVFDGDENLRPCEYLVDGVIPVEGAGMLFGESDVGKTFVATSLGVSVASEETWMGRPVLSGTVLFYEAEGGRSFALRKHAAKGAAGLGDGRRLECASFPFVTVYEPLGFGTDVDTATASATYVRAALEERGLPPVRFVVVDTLSQNLDGDADNNADMQAFLRAFRAFLKALSDEPVFGLLLHHPGHSNKDRARGAYALKADLDLVMRLEGTHDALTLSCDRMRDDTQFPPIGLRLESRVLTVDGEPLRDLRGREQTSLVVALAGSGKTATGLRDRVSEAILAALPDYPKTVGVQSYLVPKVASILGTDSKGKVSKVSKDTVSTRLFSLEQVGLVRKVEGRQVNSYAWGKTRTLGPGLEDER